MAPPFNRFLPSCCRDDDGLNIKNHLMVIKVVIIFKGFFIVKEAVFGLVSITKNLLYFIKKKSVKENEDN